MQFGLKQSELVPPGFAGGAFKYLDGHYALVLDTVYPQRSIAGKTTQIYTETMKTTMPTEVGYCFFNDANFSKLTQISCIAKAESEDRSISYNLTFEISDITVKRYNEDSHNDQSKGPPKQSITGGWNNCSWMFGAEAPTCPSDCDWYIG